MDEGLEIGVLTDLHLAWGIGGKHHLWECASLVAVSGLPLPVDVRFLAPPSQVQKCLAPGALAAGWCPGKMCSPRSYVADVGCPWAAPASALRKKSSFLTQRACPASVSPWGMWAEFLLGEEPESRGVQPTSFPPPPMQRPQMEDPGLKAPELLVGGSPLAPSLAPLLQSGLAEHPPSGSAVSTDTHIVNKVTIENRSVQRRGTVTLGPHLTRPHLPLPWPGNVGKFFSPGFQRDPDSHLNSYQPLPHKTVTFVTTSHRDSCQHTQRQHIQKVDTRTSWQSSGENSVVPMQEARVQSRPEN